MHIPRPGDLPELCRAVEEVLLQALSLPEEVEVVFRTFRTCEFATIAKDGTPIAWPTIPFWYPEQNQFQITCPPAFAQKALNVRRNPRVSLLFSDPTASGQLYPPAVLVQGDAHSPDIIKTDIKDFEKELFLVFQRQPASAMYSSNGLMRWLFDWCYMRIYIYITPRRITWWPKGDFSAEPVVMEGTRVG